MEGSQGQNPMGQPGHRMEYRPPTEHRPRRSRHEGHSDHHMVEESSSMFAGIDKNLMITVGALGITLGISFFLYREVRKLRSEMNVIIKTQRDSAESGISERIDMNTLRMDDVDQKLNHLVMALQVPLTQARENQPVQIRKAPERVPTGTEPPRQEVPEYNPTGPNRVSQEPEEDEPEEGVCFPPEEVSEPQETKKPERRRRKKVDIVI